MTQIFRMSVLLTVAIMCGPSVSWSQDSRDDALKREVERRFDVLPLRDGVALHPKTALPGVRSVEITGGTIAIDGQPATGAELRAKLGAGADAVLQLSYLTDSARRALFAGPAAPTPPVPPATPDLPQIAPPSTPELPPPPRPRRRGIDRRDGDRVRIGGDVTVEEGEVIDGDVVAVGGAVRVDGEVRGDVVAVGGTATLGSNSIVDGDVTVVGGRLNRQEGAQVRGKAQEVSLGSLDLGNWRNWRRNPVDYWWSSRLGSAFAFIGTLARVAVLCLLAALVVLFGREYMERAGSIAATSSLKAGAIGFLAQILFLPILVITIVVLVVTIVGIPLLLLLPFAILAIAVLALIGFTGVAYRVGGLAALRFGWQEQSPYAITVLGVLLLMLPVMLARLISLGGGVMFPMAIALGIAGVAIEYLAWTIGLGAMALTRFQRRGDSRTGEPSPAV